MAQITSREELEAWLKDKPADWAQAIAARAALRVLPYAFVETPPPDWMRRFALTLFQATAMPWAARNFPGYSMTKAVNIAIYPVDMAADFVPDTFNKAAVVYASACASVYSASIEDPSIALVEAAQSAAYAADADSDGGAPIWANLSYDCDWLYNDSYSDLAPRRLTSVALWPAGLGASDGLKDAWAFASAQLRALNESYQVWIEWYNRRLTGNDAAFNIPGDVGNREDKAILAKLADATNEDFWDKGATYVNTTLQGWIDEARERVKPPPKPTTAEVQAAVVKYASPDARIVDDRFDAGPNAIFDKPRYDGDLATLPSQLRAFIGALSASLPRNAPDVIRHCLTAYADELLVRGTQPIISIVKGMASAIAAQVWIAPDEGNKDNPDAWVLKDPREWEAGTADLFRTFFKAHLDLITHFPLDPEREAMLAATPIDEVAASDKALTDPIDKVTDLIITLAKDGHATDNIVRIVKALADYTRDIAGMPKPDEAGLPSTTITPKRRHVLQTAGFYLHAYSILGTTASLAPLPQVQALMTALADAAERLMAFII